jgi:GAF domain-containing protein/anti-sigma regulatory factor (Ser/Thr protein kinase)
MATLVRLTGPTDVCVVASAGPTGWTSGQVVSVSEAAVIQARRRRRPLVLTGDPADVGTAAAPGIPVVADAPMAAVGVPILVDGQVWGLLNAVDVRPRSFGADALDRLETLAALLAVPIERERAETMRVATAAFGQFALESGDLTGTLHRAVALVSEVIATPMAALSERIASGRMSFLHVLGVPGLSDGEEFEVDEGLAKAQLEHPVLVLDDWEGEPAVPVPRQLFDAGIRSTVAASIVVEGRFWGRLSAMDVWPRAFTPAEARFLESLAHLVSSALHRERMEGRLRETARQLQTALLPRNLPTLPGIEVAARYVTADEDDVGGDWYDVVAVPGGGVGLVLGDVEGHDTRAAALMGQVRNILVAYAVEGHCPEEVLRRVNQSVLQISDRLVTCCYAELHPGDGTLTLASAGHPLPVVVDRDGEPVPLAVDPGPPLGTADWTCYRERTVLLGPGSSILLRSDGLVAERRALYEDVGTLTTRMGLLVSRSVDEIADSLIAAPVTRGPLRDDASLLVARLTAPAHAPTDALPGVERAFIGYPATVGCARRFVADVLSGWDARDLGDSAELVVSELVTNAIMHTPSRLRLRMRRLPGGRVWIGVQDESDRLPTQRPPSDDDLGGRGLMIVELLSDRWGVTPSTPGGKTVWAELSTSMG